MRIWNEGATLFLFAIVFLAIVKSAIHWVFMVLGTLGLIVFLMLAIKLYKRLREKSAANDNYPFSYGSSGAHIRDAYVHHLSQLADLRMD